MAQQTNVVLVGKKPVMNYVLACLTLFQNANSEIIIKARGKAISKAADVSQILIKRFLNDVQIKDIKLNTEQLKSESGTMSNVTSIEIKLGK